MGRGVFQKPGLVIGAADDPVFQDDDRPDGHLIGIEGLYGLLERLVHIMLVTFIVAGEHGFASSLDPLTAPRSLAGSRHSCLGRDTQPTDVLTKALTGPA